MPMFKIPERNVPSLEAHLAQLAKVCKRLDLPAPTFNLWEITQEEKSRQLEDGEIYRWIEVYHHFIIEGVTPKLADWHFKAKRDIQEDGDEIRSVPGFDLPPEYRTRDICDHCGHSRKRNRYFFVQHETQGGLKQVGSSCVKDFLGHKNPETLAAWFEMVSGIVVFTKDEDEFEKGPRPTFLFYFDESFKAIIDQIRNKGFISRKKVEESNGELEYYDTTSSKVSDVLYASHSPRGKHLEVTDEDKKQIDEFFAYFEKKDENASDFIYNVKQTISAGIGVRPRKLGILCAAVNMWIRDTKEVKEFVPSEFYGEPKDRLKLVPVKFLRVAAFDGAYGSQYLYTFRDGANHEFVWSTGGKFNLEAGDEVLLSGTVKFHKTWTDRAGRDHNQTYVTRCKIAAKE